MTLSNQFIDNMPLQTAIERFKWHLAVYALSLFPLTPHIDQPPIQLDLCEERLALVTI